VGHTSGDYWRAGFFDNVADASAGIAYLRSRSAVVAVAAIGSQA
jgi:hypothetical protein